MQQCEAVASTAAHWQEEVEVARLPSAISPTQHPQQAQQHEGRTVSNAATSLLNAHTNGDHSNLGSDSSPPYGEEKEEENQKDAIANTSVGGDL